MAYRKFILTSWEHWLPHFFGRFFFVIEKIRWREQHFDFNGVVSKTIKEYMYKCISIMYLLFCRCVTSIRSSVCLYISWVQCRQKRLQSYRKSKTIEKTKREPNNNNDKKNVVTTIWICSLFIMYLDTMRRCKWRQNAEKHIQCNESFTFKKKSRDI